MDILRIMGIKSTKIILILVIMIVVIIGLVLFSEKSTKYATIINNKDEYMDNLQDKKVRKPTVAGRFYPLVAADLKSTIDDFLDKAKLPEIEEGKKPHILIVPHAGYAYSGQVAAYGFKTLQGFKYDSVIVLGSSHIAPFPGVALYDGDAIETPLGQTQVDKDLIHKLTAFNHRAVVQNSVHVNEHSLEVELPFLQKVLGQDFKVVFALLGGKDLTDIQNFAESLSQILISNPKTLLIISSDLSHYPAYQDAQYSDKKVIEAILTREPDNLVQAIQKLESANIKNLDTCACGQAAIMTAMYVAQELDFKPQLLNYANSGDVAMGEKNRVVGYASIIFLSSNVSKVQNADNVDTQNVDTQNVDTQNVDTQNVDTQDIASLPTTDNPSVDTQNVETQNFASLSADNRLPKTQDIASLQNPNLESRKLNSEEQHVSLKLARQTIEKEFKLRDRVNENYKNYPIFDQDRGVFVTLHKHGDLRGCIGLIEPIKKLGQCIQEMAISAAFNDPRFQPLTKQELEDIVVEVSVLTPPQKIGNPYNIELGKHGVIVRSGSRSGVFLPQVAEDTAWNLEQFMGHLCVDKAGLSLDCWKTGEVDIYTFEAQVFEEN